MRFLVVLCLALGLTPAWSQTETKTNNFGSAPIFSIAAPTDGQCLTYLASQKVWQNSSSCGGGGGGSGTVTSVGATSGDSSITITGSPITTSGTFGFSVNPVPLSNLANVAGNSFVCNNTGSPAHPIACTATQAKAVLAISNTDVSGLGTLATQNGTFSGTSSGTNTGDQTITLTGDITGSGTGSFPATLATVNSNVGSFTNASVTVNGKGLVTAASNGTAPPSAANPSGLIGMSAVNGSATTFERSDASHAIDPSITPSWTAEHIWNFTGQTAATNVVGTLVENTTAASSGNQQYMCNELASNGWGTTAGTSQVVAWYMCAQPSQGATPSAGLNLLASVNGGALVSQLSLGSSAVFAANFGVSGASFNATGSSCPSTGIVRSSTNVLGLCAGAALQDTLSATVASINQATVNIPNISSTSTAQTGTVCWSTGGSLTVDTTTTCLLSARRFKERINPLDEGLSAVLALNPVSYYFKSGINVGRFADDPNTTGEQIGFIAEDVQKVDPRLVTTEPDGQLHSVRYQQMTALLAKALQEEHALVVKQQRDIARQQFEICCLALWCAILTLVQFIRRGKG